MKFLKTIRVKFMLSRCLADLRAVTAKPEPAFPRLTQKGTVTPEILNLLPPDERGQYQTLIDAISCDVQKAKRHSGLEEFVKHISLVHKFVARGNTNDALRGIVCGVEFGRGFILVNTDRLKKVLFRSKSCMNGCFQRLGYDVMRPSRDIVCLFTRLLPNVNPEFFAIRQWCVRLVGDGSVICFCSNLPDAIASSFEVHRIPSQRMFLESQKVPMPPPAALRAFPPIPPRVNMPELNLMDIRTLLNPKTVTC
jgi:hypothetical protein